MFTCARQKHPSIRVQGLPHETFPSGLEFFHKHRHATTAITVHANYFQGQVAKRDKLRSAGVWEDVPIPGTKAKTMAQEGAVGREDADDEEVLAPLHAPPAAMVTAGPDITIIGFTNYGMLDFALNWLWHLREAIGTAEMEARLLMYCVGEDTKAALVASGMVTQAMIR